ncbi:hypothetical protein [Carnobacterium sp. FSL E2-0243]|uniref:hypothetical protein n=1 Tax=Carnobacterium sp. FSL E2-0243 TaxID=2921365 RepID=UPI0030F5FE23
MIYAVFKASKELKKLVNKRNKLQLVEANTLIVELDRYAEEQGFTSSVEITIYENESILFRDEVLVGEGTALNLILLVNSTLTTTFADTPEEEKRALMKKIENEFMNAPSVIHSDEPQEKVEIKEKRVSQSIKPTIEVEVVHKELPEIKQKNKKIKSPKIGMTKKTTKIVLIVVPILIFSSTVSVLFFNSFSSDPKASQSNSEVSSSVESDGYKKLIEQNNYLKAYNDYPKNQSEILALLVKDNNKAGLKEIAEGADSKEAFFDYYFLNKEWKKVIEYQVVSKSKERQAMLAYAYIQEGKIEEAEIINEVLMNKELTLQMEEYKLTSAYKAIQDGKVDEAKKMNEMLKNDDLEAALSNAQIAVTLLKKYEKDSSDPNLSPEVQNEAKKNAEAMRVQLKEIGKGYLNE